MLLGLLDKAEAQRAADGSEALLSARLAPDMWPLATQLRLVTLQPNPDAPTRASDLDTLSYSARSVPYPPQWRSIAFVPHALSAAEGTAGRLSGRRHSWRRSRARAA